LRGQNAQRAVWDGNSYIFSVGSEILSDGKNSLFLVTYDGQKWTSQKLLESWDLDSNFLFDKGVRKTIVFDSVFSYEPFHKTIWVVERDAITGTAHLEPLEPAYAQYYQKESNIPWFDIYSSETWSVGASLIADDGRFHIIADEGPEGDMQMYYHIYDPYSATPNVPVFRELIDEYTW